MLVPQNVQLETSSRQGSRTVPLDELRKSLTEPTRLSDWHRQRLLELVQRLERVRALGDGYAGIDLSDDVIVALKRTARAAS